MTNALLAIGLCGFHVAITLLALYRAYQALRNANTEGLADAKTMWRLSLLRLVGAAAGVSGGLLGLIAPLIVLADLFPGRLIGYQQAFVMISVAAWLVWIPSTIGLDNLAKRWF